MTKGRRGADRLLAELSARLGSYNAVRLGHTDDLEPVAKAICMLPYRLEIVELKQSGERGIGTIYREGKLVAMLRRTNGIAHLGYDPELLTTLAVDKRSFEEAMKGALNPA